MRHCWEKCEIYEITYVRSIFNYIIFDWLTNNYVAPTGMVQNYHDMENMGPMLIHEHATHSCAGVCTIFPPFHPFLSFWLARREYAHMIHIMSHFGYVLSSHVHFFGLTQILGTNGLVVVVICTFLQPGRHMYLGHVGGGVSWWMHVGHRYLLSNMWFKLAVSAADMAGIEMHRSRRRGTDSSDTRKTLQNARKILKKIA